MPELKFTVDGHVQLSRNLRLFAKDMKDLMPFFREAIDIIASRSDELFSSEGAAVQKAGKWPQLAASTLKAREKRWGYYKKTPNNPGILRWTGNLQGHKNKNITNAFGELTFTEPYAPFHQRGGGRLPQRVIIDLSNETNAEVVRALQRKIHEALGIFGRQA